MFTVLNKIEKANIGTGVVVHICNILRSRGRRERVSGQLGIHWKFRAKTSYVMRLTFKQRNKIIKFKNNIALIFKDWCYYINILKEMSHSYDVIHKPDRIQSKNKSLQTKLSTDYQWDGLKHLESSNGPNNKPSHRLYSMLERLI